jgi:hypothetical protein
MTKEKDKTDIDRLKKEYPKTERSIEFMRLRQELEDEISDKNGLWCFCRRGQRATKEHEMNCQKFQHKVDLEMLKILNHHNQHD